MASLATPRILPSHLSHFPQKVVIILGTITSLHGDSAQLTSCNNEVVTLILNRYGIIQCEPHDDLILLKRLASILAFTLRSRRQGH